MIYQRKQGNSSLVRAIGTCGGKPAAKAVLVGVLILWLVLSAFVAVNPALHHWLHHDADHQSHDCPITLVEKHQVLSADVGVEIKAGKVGFAFQVSIPNDVVRPGTPFSIQFGRAPPV